MKKLLFIITTFLVFACEPMDPAEPGNLVAKTVDEDASVPSVTLSETKLHVQTFGKANAPKIFVLEGGPGDDFRYMLPLNSVVNGWSLPSEYQVIYHDYRGCGLSRRHPMEELTMAKSLKDLEELIDRYAPGEQVILIGHSHGGKVAAQYLNQHRERVRGAIFLEPGAFSSEIVKKTPSASNLNYFGKDLNQVLWAKQLIGMGDHERADYVYDLAKANVKDEERGEQCPYQSYRSGTAAVINIALDEVENSTYDFTTNLKNVDAKVLFISSEETTDIGYDFQEQYQVGFFKKHEHIKIPDTGHDGLLTCKATETLQHIRKYLNEL